MGETKQCIKCKRVLSMHEFKFVGGGNPYRRNVCSNCQHKRTKEIRATRIAKHLCSYCGRPNQSGHKMCLMCREKMVQYGKKRSTKHGKGSSGIKAAPVTLPSVPQPFNSDELREDTRKIRDNFLLKADKEEEAVIKLAIQKGLRGKEAWAIVNVWKEERAEIA